MLQLSLSVGTAVRLWSACSGPASQASLCVPFVFFRPSPHRLMTQSLRQSLSSPFLSSPFSSLPSSHSSPGSSLPLPQFSLERQSDEQPSPSTLLPSSQISLRGSSRSASPLGFLNGWSSFLLPHS